MSRALRGVAFTFLAAIILCPPSLLSAQGPIHHEGKSPNQIYRYGQFDVPSGPVSIPGTPVAPRGDITGAYAVYDTLLTQSNFVAAGDLENDGYNDVVSSSYYDGVIAILHQSPQTHSLQLVARWDVTVGGARNGVGDVYIEDMNSDGLKDIVAFDLLNGLVAIFLQTSQYGVFDRTQVDIGYFYNRGGVGDLNNDGHQDLMWTNENKVYVAYQTGSGFAPPVIFSVPIPPWRIMALPIVGDVNGDGLPDLIAVDGYSISLFVWESPTWQLQIFASPMNGPTEVTVGDLDGDGVQDIVAPGSGTDTVGVFWGPDLTSTLLTGGISYGNSRDVAIGDVDGDSRSELVVTDVQTYKLMIWKFTGRNPLLRIVSANAGPGQVLISDLNGDGLQDIAYGLAGYTAPPHAPVTVHYQVPPVKTYLPSILYSP